MKKATRKQKKQSLTADTVKVHLLDWKHINDEVTSVVLDKGVKERDGSTRRYPEGTKFEARFVLGIIDKPRFALINDECVGFTESSKDDYRVDFYLKSDGKSIHMFPSFNVAFTRKMLEEYRTGETKTVKEFMGARYNYNGRIVGNLSNLLKYLETGKV